MPFFIFEKFILIKKIPSDFTRRRDFYVELDCND